MSYIRRKPWPYKPPLSVPVDISHPILRDAVGIWTFREGAGGTLFDASGKGHHGSMTSSLAGEWTHTRGGSALDFGGPSASNYVDVGTLPELDTWTILAIATPRNNTAPTASEGDLILTNDRSGWNDDVLFGISPEGYNESIGGALRSKWGVIHQDATSSTRTMVGTSYDAPLNVRTFAAATADGSTLGFYLNGTLEDSAAKTGTSLKWGGSSTGNRIGNNSGLGGIRFFDGLIEFVALIGRAASSIEIADWYARENTIYQPRRVLMPATTASSGLPIAVTNYYRRMFGAA